MQISGCMQYTTLFLSFILDPLVTFFCDPFGYVLLGTITFFLTYGLCDQNHRPVRPARGEARLEQCSVSVQERAPGIPAFLNSTAVA